MSVTLFFHALYSVIQSYHSEHHAEDAEAALREVERKTEKENRRIKEEAAAEIEAIRAEMNAVMLRNAELEKTFGIRFCSFLFYRRSQCTGFIESRELVLP